MKILKSLNSLSVVIPVYNSEQSLPLLIDRLHEILTEYFKSYEVILVNDGSQDKSWEAIVFLSKKFSWIKGIDLMRNYGQHNALLCGIRHSQNDIIVTMDDDLQNPPEEIPRLVARLGEGYDVVYGTPKKKRHGWWRDMSSGITKVVLRNIMGTEAVRHVSAFRAFRSELRESFKTYEGSFVSIDVLLTWGTTRFSHILVHHDNRIVGSSNYSLSALIIHAVNMFTGFSILPLELASVLGILCTVFGIIILLFVIINYFVNGSPVPGFTFLASIIAIFSGAQLLSIGIIGEYLARMHSKAVGRPTFTVREIRYNKKNKDSTR